MTGRLAIVGGGPAGLCAAINGASEGLEVTLFDEGPLIGGQARESMAIENYPGFPGGIAGEDLICRFIEQSDRFGVVTFCPARIERLDRDGKELVLTDDEGWEYRSDAVLLANGVRYRRHRAKGLSNILGRGVYYGLPSPNSLPRKGHVAVVGGANSAGQAACFLASKGLRVSVLSRSPLAKSMSQYLIDRLDALPNVFVDENVEIASVGGNGKLEWFQTKTGGTVPLHALYLFIGAAPRTGWLKQECDLDERGFLVTGPHGVFSTNRPGVFAAGDIRAGSVKRVASAVGEGAGALQAIHAYLADLT